MISDAPQDPSLRMPACLGQSRPRVLLSFLMRFEDAPRMLEGIVQYQRAHEQWDTFLDDEARSIQDLGWLESGNWQGIICRHTTAAMAEQCKRLGIPLIDVNDNSPIPGVPKIRPDNTAIGHSGAEHFLERGYRHFGFSGFRNEIWSRERRDGFVEALRLAGHTCHIYDVDYPGVVTPTWDVSETSALAAWLKGLPKPIAVMACVDVRAFELIRAARQAELLVPEEVALLGVNNDTIRCELCSPPLSSVATNAFQCGYLAAERLDQMLSGDADVSLEVMVEPLDIVTRRSSDMLAIDDRQMVAALRLIHAQACSGVTVDEIVGQVPASRSQLEKKFRRFIGRSPQAEIRRVQTAKVRALLLETDFPLKRIAELTGFEHVEYMCVVFKRITGHSPGEFRQVMQSTPRKPRARKAGDASTTLDRRAP